MSLLSELVRFFFGTGGWIAWHVLFLLAVGIGVLLPLAALCGDALKQPPPAASLGTVGCVMLVALVLGATTPVAAGTALGAAGWNGALVAVLALGAGAAVAVLVGWLLMAMAERGGQTLVALSWMIVIALVIGHLATLRWATQGPAPVAPPSAPPAGSQPGPE